MKTPFLTIAIFVSLAALNAGAAAGTRTVTTETEATYEVPVPDELKDVATFTLDGLYESAAAGKITRTVYTLPLELTGIPNTIAMTARGPGVFKGPNGKAICQGDTCQVRFKNLKIDRTLAAAALTKEGFTGLDFDRRMQVFDRFSGDPAGVIRKSH